MSNILIDLESAQKIVTKAFPYVSHSVVVEVSEISTRGSFGFTPSIQTYLLDLSSAKDSPSTHTAFLTVSSPLEDGDNPYAPNTFPVFSHLISLIRSRTPVPLSPPILDTSCTLIPYSYLLTPPEQLQSSSIISLSSARQQKLLSPEQEALVDLGLGQLLAQLHSKIQNDWFGRAVGPETTVADPSYSWQETFTSLLESQLSYLQASSNSQALNIPYEELRLCLGRAVAFYLFDDVEVPSLVWFTGSEDDIYIFEPTPSTNPKEPPTIAAFLPNLTHALWGDPLMETFFLPSTNGKSLNPAMMEGYREGGGEPLQVFPRQKTKRLWYTVFLTLIILTEHSTEDEKYKWAINTLKDCVAKLKDAPCY